MILQGNSHPRFDQLERSIVDLIRRFRGCRMACVHEYESQYETTEGRFAWSGIAVAASVVRGGYAADLHTNHG